MKVEEIVDYLESVAMAHIKNALEGHSLSDLKVLDMGGLVKNRANTLAGYVHIDVIEDEKGNRVIFPNILKLGPSSGRIRKTYKIKKDWLPILESMPKRTIENFGKSIGKLCKSQISMSIQGKQNKDLWYY